MWCSCFGRCHWSGSWGSARVQQSSLDNVVFVAESYLHCNLLGGGTLQSPNLDHARVPGRVVCAITVGENGAVRDSEVVAGHILLDDLATQYVMSLRFAPLSQGGKTRKMRGYFTVMFDLVKNKPVLGLDLPVIWVLRDGAFRVSGQVYKSSGELIQFLESEKVEESRKTIHVAFEDRSGTAAVLESLSRFGTAICVHAPTR